MQNCHPRLSEYFHGSYGKLQQQISLFIKGFPLIQLHNMGSINDLIGLLIQQNSMLSTRFREQLAQIKENFKKSEQHEAELKSKQTELMQMLTEREEEIGEVRRMVEHREELVKEQVGEIARLQQETERYKSTQTNLSEVEAGVRDIRPKLLTALNQLLEPRFVKNPDIFVDKLSSLKDHLCSLTRVVISKRLQQQRVKLQEDLQRFSDLIEEKCKHERSKQKVDKQKNTQLLSSIQQMQCTVSEWVGRCRDTVGVVRGIGEEEGAVLAKFWDGLEGELGRLEKGVRQIKEKSLTLGSEKNASENRKSAENTVLSTPKAAGGGAFQNVLKTLSSSMGQGKKAKQYIEQIDSFKAQIRQLNAKIRQDSQDFEKYMSQTQKTHRQQISMKQQLLKYYQQNLIETKQRLQSEQSRCDSLSKQIQQLTSELQSHQSTILTLEHQKEQILEKVEQAERVIMLLEDEKNKLQGKIKEKDQMTDRKVVELAEQLTETERVKRNLADQYERDRIEMMRQVEQERRTQVELTNSLLALKQSVEKENEALSIKAAKVVQLEQLRQAQNKEVKSMQDLIKQMELKLRQQSSQLRKKQTIILQQQKRIKSLLSQNQSNLTQVKSLKSSLPQLSTLKSSLEQSQLHLNRLTEQNHSLKSLLKLAKTDVQDSRQKITLLMEIQHEREILKLKCEAYGKQIQGIHKEKEEKQREVRELTERVRDMDKHIELADKRRIDGMRLEAENRRLEIELKHCRGLLKKIEQLREVM